MTLAGRIAVVTGATDGIGRATALELARRGMTVVLHGRSAERLDEARAFVAQHAPGATLETARGDLGSLKETDALGRELAARFPAVHALVLNAGVFADERRESADGYELTLAVNHLAHHLLTRALTTSLAAGAASGHGRVVTVASIAHLRGKIHWDDPMLTQGYTGYAAYAQSKLMNVLFAAELARKVGKLGITSNSLHPGVITTKLLRAGFNISGAPVTEGAKTSVKLATDASLAKVTGGYFSDEQRTRPHALADDAEARERLWTVSEQWIAEALAR